MTTSASATDKTNTHISDLELSVMEQIKFVSSDFPSMEEKLMKKTVRLELANEKITETMNMDESCDIDKSPAQNSSVPASAVKESPTSFSANFSL